MELPVQNGKYTGDSLDLIGTDEIGNVWLISKKRNEFHQDNSKYGWSLLNTYANTIRKWSETELVLSARRYLLKVNESFPYPPFLPHATSGLSDAFGQWAMTLGKKYIDGLALYEMTMQKIKNKEAIHCLLSDQDEEEIWNNRPSDTVTTRAIIMFSVGEAKIWRDGPLEKNPGVIGSQWKHGTWTSLMERPGPVKPTPERLPLLLTDNVIPTYTSILRFMQELGWNGKYTANPKAFRFDLPTIYSEPIRIHIGWVKVEENNSSQARTPYQLGLKFNIDFKQFIRSSDKELQDMGYSLAKRLARKARYHNKGTDFSILESGWTVEDVRSTSWEGDMYRYIDDKNRYFTGLPEEQKDLEGAFLFLQEIVSRNV
ncbi:hypothetical protein [Sporosarcina cyprini]|uniref:hypothetical protein n=1 Tax=Sporosarcina cyprini TaxID=2910523 RepID=UPI001EDD9E5A|nr:hypothetical protein [Sporosarcina cyprini]MCG3088255.1 hypothetical protein [Sporosarcina cyprini]